jgi:Kef-type K+ transport system membrane component KefB
VDTKASFLLISFLIVILPWLLWQFRPVRRVAPLAVVQIMAGVVLGPSCFGLLAPEIHGALFTKPVLSLLDGVAGIGVLLYVFATGLHLDTAALRRDTRRLGLLAVGSISVPLLLGLGAGLWMLANVPGALGTSDTQAGFLAAVAICIAVTALPVLAAILGEMGLLPTRLGQQGLAVAALNDAALWLMLAVLLPLTASGGTASPLVHLGLSVLWFAVLAMILRPLLLRFTNLSDKSVLVIGTALAILSSSISEALGTGYLIGAFGAGAAMPAAWRAPILARLEMLTATVLLPFFFMSTGLKALIDPGSSSFLAVLVLATGATIIGKVVGTAATARFVGFDWRQSLSLGVMMQTKGLMEVVVLAVLNDAGLIGREIFSAMVAMAVICTLVTAPMLRALSAKQRVAEEIELQGGPA